MPTFCELIDVRKSYAGQVVLDIPRLALEAGRITGVVGPNGSGKTTLLQIAALLLRPDAGHVRIWDKAARCGDRHLRETVVMVMHPGLMFRGTVGSNVLYGLRARGVSRKEAARRAAAALEAVGMSGFARRGPVGLSAGERQRVNLARAIALKPEALLLDEPTANVDTTCVQVVQRVLAELRGEGATIVHTSPATNGLEPITDDVVHLNRGRSGQ